MHRFRRGRWETYTQRYHTNSSAVPNLVHVLGYDWAHDGGVHVCAIETATPERLLTPQEASVIAATYPYELVRDKTSLFDGRARNYIPLMALIAHSNERLRRRIMLDVYQQIEEKTDGQSSLRHAEIANYFDWLRFAVAHCPDVIQPEVYALSLGKIWNDTAGWDPLEYVQRTVNNRDEFVEWFLYPLARNVRAGLITLGAKREPVEYRFGLDNITDTPIIVGFNEGVNRLYRMLADCVSVDTLTPFNQHITHMFERIGGGWEPIQAVVEEVARAHPLEAPPAFKERLRENHSNRESNWVAMLVHAWSQ